MRTKTGTTTFLQLVLVTVANLVVFLPDSVTGLAVSDNTVRCQSHPNPSESLDVCVGSFIYYYIPDWLDPSNTGYWWIYNFVEDEMSGNGIGGQVFVKLELDYSACSIGMGSGFSSNDRTCQSCEYCGSTTGGPDGLTNGLFKADCTNLPGGRNIDTCESTDPFFFPVDWYSDDYLNQGSTSVPDDTMAPSDQDSYEASDSPSGNDSDSKDSDSKDNDDSNDSSVVKKLDSDEEQKSKTMPTISSDETASSTTKYSYQSEMKVTMDVSPTNPISTMDAEIVLEKYKDFLLTQDALAGFVDSIDLVFQSHQQTNGDKTVLIEFETNLGMNDELSSSVTQKQVATSMATNVDWSDFIVNYLRKTQGGAFKRTSGVHLKLIGEGGGPGAGRLRKLSLLFEVSGEGSI